MSLILDGTNGLSDVDGSASTPAIRGTDTNTGIFFPAADTIAFAEGGAEVARFDSSGNLGLGTSSPSNRLDVSGNAGVTGNLSFNSGYGSSAIAYGCRAWVNFNGTGTIAIRASGNVSSITDGGTGNYTVNFTNAMPNENYSCVGSSGDDGAFGSVFHSAGVSSPPTTSGIRVLLSNNNGTGRVDDNYVFVAIFR